MEILISRKSGKIKNFKKQNLRGKLKKIFKIIYKKKIKTFYSF